VVYGFTGKERAMLRAMTKYWWTFLVRGIVALLFGVAAFIWPGLTIAALITLFGAFALVDGIFAVINSVGGRAENERWWVHFLEGVAGIGAGLVTFFWPGVTAVALLFIIAFWAIWTGVFEIALAIRLRKEIEGEWALGLSGLLSVLMGALLMARPGAGALAVVWVIGAYALAFSVLLFLVAFKLRKLGAGLENVVAAGAH
jgi:uncharacterized membrane protein HdeD (DUF308 family)